MPFEFWPTSAPGRRGQESVALHLSSVFTVGLDFLKRLKVEKNANLIVDHLERNESFCP